MTQLSITKVCWLPDIRAAFSETTPSCATCSSDTWRAAVSHHHFKIGWKAIRYKFSSTLVLQSMHNYFDFSIEIADVYPENDHISFPRLVLHFFNEPLRRVILDTSYDFKHQILYDFDNPAPFNAELLDPLISLIAITSADMVSKIMYLACGDNAIASSSYTETAGQIAVSIADRICKSRYRDLLGKEMMACFINRSITDRELEYMQTMAAKGADTFLYRMCMSIVSIRKHDPVHLHARYAKPYHHAANPKLIHGITKEHIEEMRLFLRKKFKEYNEITTE